MNKTVKWILISLGVLIAILVLVKAFGKKGPQGTKVTAEKAQVRTIVETVSATGKIYPEVEVPISPDISGEITELNVAEGDSVRKGQVLARIYADIYSSQRDEAAARVSQAQATVANSQASLSALQVQLDQDRVAYERNKSLFDQKVISRAELETFETRYRTSQANYAAAQQNIRSLQAGAQGSRSTLQMANKNLGRTTIVAPMSGVVTSLKVKKGQKVVGTGQMAGTEMMVVSDIGTIEVRVEVGENDIVKVNLGDSADVAVEAYNNRKFRGLVTQIASSTAKGNAVAAAAGSDVTNYEVHIRLDPASYADLQQGRGGLVFRPGMNASADIKTRRKEGVVTVPIGAVAARAAGSEDSEAEKKKETKKESGADEEVSTDALEEVVFVIGADNKVQKRVVTTGIQNINHIEIVSGLKAGETVVTGPYTAVSNSLKSGRQVVVVSKEELFEEK